MNDCRCNLPAHPTTENLRPLGMGCTGDLLHPYCCPVLDKARREATRREGTTRRLAKLGVAA